MNCQSEKGFFTLEALVALAITSFVLVSYLHATTDAVRGTAQSKSRQDLVALGLSLLDSVDAGTVAKDGVSMQGEVHGNFWTVSQQIILSQNQVSEQSSKPVVLVFQARDALGRVVVDLRTIKIGTGTHQRN